MKFYKPKFWDKQDFPNLISILLLPISLITIIKNYYEKQTQKVENKPPEEEITEEIAK